VLDLLDRDTRPDVFRPAPPRGVSKPETTLSSAAVLHEMPRYFVNVTLVSRSTIPRVFHFLDRDTRPDVFRPAPSGA
jgi:hypothetical protein